VAPKLDHLNSLATKKKRRWRCRSRLAHDVTLSYILIITILLMCKVSISVFTNEVINPMLKSEHVEPGHSTPRPSPLFDSAPVSLDEA
jgi:hypothetical protein